MKMLSLTAVLAITLFLAASSASAFVVDHFSNTASFTLATSGLATGPVSQTDPYNPSANILPMGPGTTRFESLTQNAFDGGNPGNGSSFIHDTFADTDVDISNDNKCSSDLVLTYTFNPTDFTVGGTQTALSILWVASDLVGETAILTVTDNLGHISDLSQATTQTGNFSQNFSYGSFLPVSGSANFADLVSVELQINSVQDGEYELDALETTPEPATMGLLGLGLAALVARRKRAAK